MAMIRWIDQGTGLWQTVGEVAVQSRRVILEQEPAAVGTELSGLPTPLPTP